MKRREIKTSPQHQLPTKAKNLATVTMLLCKALVRGNELIEL